MPWAESGRLFLKQSVSLIWRPVEAVQASSHYDPTTSSGNVLESQGDGELRWRLADTRSHCHPSRIGNSRYKQLWVHCCRLKSMEHRIAPCRIVAQPWTVVSRAQIEV
ncbi:hypothetical protein AcV7_006618 [Taiwanofungus camphoratus]|nr:hypothetical protein AcV7_006618 [Antrodia cinnamomea]